ncbi:hypothetical protein ACLKA7_003649 [Drosophila subpalustris]
MEKDLDFLINAMSRSSSPLRRIYSQDQLLDMRDSFITLQTLLRRNPIDMDDISCYPVRVKAGGNTDWNLPHATELPNTAVPMMKLQFSRKNVSTSARNSVSSVLIRDVQVDRTEKGFEPRSQGSRELMTESDDRAASGSENFQALVPYQEKNSSRELVRYTPPSEESEDSETEELESETLCANPSFGNTSIVSFRIPVEMEMECVWCNQDYTAESTTSDMTIIADGCNFILSN